MNKRIRLKDNEAKALNLEVKSNKDSDGRYPRYSLNETQIEHLTAIRDASRNHNIPLEDIHSGWLKNKESSIYFQNPNFRNDSNSLLYSLESKLSSLIEKYKYFKHKEIPNTKSNSKAIKITVSDSHIGMNPNPNNGALFQYEYNKEIYKESNDKIFSEIKKAYETHGKFDLLLLDDLGDLADGWNGYTTRGGHELPQNMTNSEVFDVCVDEKVNLISRIVNQNITNKIILRSICNDNHSGDFALIINKAIQKVINILYGGVVEVDILERFLEHRFYGNHCFILTHGKDKSNMFKGLPLILTDKAIKFISDYISHYEIKSPYIHVEKGDLHQICYQKTSNFDYRNFMSFAPPSSWVQHNFGDSYSGYSIQVIDKYKNEISHTDYFLDYKKKI